MLQNFIFIPIDNFLAKLHNIGIRNELDAWLTFLGCDEPDYIIRLIKEYPQFKPMYQQLYDLCRNVEGVMSMLSKELQLMDQNTVKYMIDEYQEEVNTLTAENEALSTENKTLSSEKEALSAEKEALSKELKKYREKFGKL